MVKQKWTEALLYDRVVKRYAGNGYVVLPGVRNFTGSSGRQLRTADAIVVSTWPSRGLSLTGIEIKVSAGDWRKELADPGKAHAIQKYCHFWYVVAPKGVIELGTVPINWGLIECESRRTIERRVAPKADPAPIDMRFLASILRTAASTMCTQEEIKTKVGDLKLRLGEARKEVQSVSDARYELGRLKKSVAAFEASSGVTIAESWYAESIGTAVKCCVDAGLPRMVRSMQEVAQELTACVEALREAEKTTGLQIMPENTEEDDG